MIGEVEQVRDCTGLRTGVLKIGDGCLSKFEEEVDIWRSKGDWCVDI